MPVIAARPVWGKRLSMGLLLMLMGAPLALADSAFVPAEQPIGYVGQVELSTDDLRAGGAVAFHGQFERRSWSGNLLARRIDGAGNIEVDSTWWPGGAADLLATQNHDTGRLIATMKDGTGVPFRFSSLSTRQQGYLESSNVLDFLRGDRSCGVDA